MRKLHVLIQFGIYGRHTRFPRYLITTSSILTEAVRGALRSYSKNAVVLLEVDRPATLLSRAISSEGNPFGLRSR
jgi:hypothetical protein